MLLAATTANAQDSSAPVLVHQGFLHSVLASIVFGLVGIVLAIVGFKLFDFITPFNLEKEICQEKNIAVGILCAAIVLGICHISAASMS
jgi:putative membrane protein